MKTILLPVLSVLTTPFRSRLAMQVEILALRHQLSVHLPLRQQLAIQQQRGRRPRLRRSDWVFWVWLFRLWCGWREALLVVKMET